METGLLHCLVCGCNSVQGEKILLSGERLVDAIFFRVEILDGTGDLDRKRGGVEVGDEFDAANTVKKILPVCLYVVANRGDDSHSCHYYSFAHYFPDKIIDILALGGSRLCGSRLPGKPPESCAKISTSGRRSKEMWRM